MKNSSRTGTILKVLALFSLMMGGIACHKSSTTCNGVPNVAVNFSLDLNQPTNVNLMIVEGSVVVSGGYDNVMVYRYTTSQFTAFDGCCPYDGASNNKAVVQINANKFSATCPVCGSTFQLSDGSVTKGPSKCGLKPYNATFDGVSTVTVTN